MSIFEKCFAIKFNAIFNELSCYGSLIYLRIADRVRPFSHAFIRRQQSIVIHAMRLDYLFSHTLNRRSKFISMQSRLLSILSHKMSSASIVATQQVGDSCSGFPFPLLTSVRRCFHCFMKFLQVTLEFH